MAGSIADFNKRIAETKTRLAAEKKSSSGSSSKDVVVDPKTGRTWGSVEEYVTDPRKYGGGGGSSGRSFKEEFARRQASKAAEQVAAQKAVELKAQQQAARELAATRTQTALRDQERQRVSEAKTFEDKTRISREIVEQRKGRAELERIQKERADIIASGGRVETRKSIEADTKAELEITTTKGKKDRRIFEVKNLLTGETKIKTYAPGKGGGGARQTGGVSIIKEEGVQIGPTRKDFEEQQRKLKQGEVQPFKQSFFGKVKDLPSKIIEKVTGKKPREVFRFITGSSVKDVTKPVTLGEAVVETTTVPKKALSIIATGAGAGAEAISRKVLPEGIDVTLPSTKEKEISFLEPQFGTVTPESKSGFIERTVIIPSKGERIVKVFEPERVGQGVKIGTQIAVIGAAPVVFAPGFITGGTQTALDPTKKPLERVLGGAEALLGTAIIGGKVFQLARTPVTTRTPTRPIKTSSAVEVSKVVKVAGKPKTVSLFEIRGEVTPPIKVITTTRLRQVADVVGRKAEKLFTVGGKPVINLKVGPKSVKIIPARTFSTITPTSVVSGKPFLVSEVIQGRRYGTLIKVKGTDAPISLKEFKSLPKTEKFLLQRRAEQIVGRKVPLEQVPKILEADIKRTSSFIESEKLLKIKPTVRTAELKFIPKGKRVTRAVSVTETRPLGSTDFAESFQAKTFFKDVTLPGSRATGRTPELDTTIIRVKPTPDPRDAIKFIKPADIKKTPLSKTFQEVKTITTPAVSQVPLPEPIVVKTGMIIETLPKTSVEKTLPLIVGGIGGTKTESVFAGQGEFELTTPQITSILGPSKIETQQPQAEILQVKSQIGISKQLQRPAQIEIMKSMEAQKSIQQSKQIGAQKSIQQPKQLQAQKLIQATKQISAQKELLSLRSSQVFKTPSIATPSPSPIVLPPTKLTPAKKALGKLTKVVKGEFEIFARESGVDVSIGKAKTKKEAFELLKKELGTSLKASGFVKRGKEKIAPTTFFNNQFRISTKDPMRIVERKERRLKKAGREVEEIQFFKKKKAKGKSKGWF